MGAVTKRRIYRIGFRQENQDNTATVGERFGEIVIAIFQGQHGYYICTPNHGVFHGQPLLVSYDCVTHIELFEPFES
jgi:hypothetical protein